jgi:hypothetical protein
MNFIFRKKKYQSLYWTDFFFTKALSDKYLGLPALVGADRGYSFMDWDLLTYPIVTLGLWFVDLPVVGPTGQPPPCQADERQRSRVNSFIYLLKRIIKMSIGSEKQITLHGGPKAIMQSIQVYAMSVFRRNYVTLWLMQFLVFCGVILKLKTACPGWPGEKWWHVI